MNINRKSDKLKGGIYINFRKKDYLISYVLILIIYILNLMAPVEISELLLIAVFVIFPALVLGTITNLFFKKK